MLSPAAMRKARIFVLGRQVDRVARALGRLGVMHLRSSVEESEGKLQPEEVGEELQRCRHLMDGLQGVMSLLEVEEEEHVPQARPQDAPAPAPFSVEEGERLVALLESRVAEQSRQLDRLSEGLADTDEILRELAPYRDVNVPLSGLDESAFVELKAGMLERRQLDRMRGAMPDGVLLIPLAEGWAATDEPAELMVVSSRRRRFAVETVLGEHGFQEKPVPAHPEETPAAVYEEAGKRKGALEERIAEVRRLLREVGQGHGKELRQTARALAAQLKLLEAEQNFGTTWATAVISGWVPAAQVDELRRTVTEVTGGQAVIEILEPDREDIERERVPSLVAHGRFLAPFQRLVHGYGVACYTEIEPTVMFAASFLLLFGIIFGDLGHGACLLVAGLLMRRWAKGAGVRDMGFVVAMAGLSAMLFGTFFQGSFFGKSLADLGFPLTLGFEPIRLEGEGAGAAEHVVRYLILAIVLGMALISLGTILNIINRLRRGDYAEGLLGRFGVAGIIFYWGALALAVKLVVAGAGAVDLWLAILVIGLPLTVLVLHEPIYALLTHRKPLWRDSPLMGFFQGLIEAMETVMVYLANTFSFLRVAAFALSHAALCFTIFVLQRLVNDLPGGLIWSAIIFVLGTAVIIGLEGLIVTVQIMRLEYYEFFTKFFRGEGVRYEPFRLE